MNSNQQIGLSLLSAAVITLWLCTSRGELLKFYKKIFNWKRLSETELITVLDQLALANMEILTELTHMVCGIRASLQSRGLETSLHQHELEATLMEQSFETRFKDAQAKVFEKFGLSEQDVAESCNAMMSSESIKSRVEGLSLMFSDALSGTLPVLPCVELPQQLESSKELLELIEASKKKRLEKLQDVLINVDPQLLIETPESKSTRFPPSTELNELLKKTVNEAEAIFIEDKLSLPDSLMLYRHAVATHSRKNPNFLIAKSELDTLYSRKTVDSIKNAIYFATEASKLLTQPSSSCPYFSANDLSKCIVETKDTKIVCQILPSLSKDAKEKEAKSKHTDEFVQAFKTLKFLPPASFYYTTVDQFNAALDCETRIEAEPIVDKDHPVYAVFLNSKLITLCHNIPNLFDKLLTPGSKQNLLDT